MTKNFKTYKEFKNTILDILLYRDDLYTIQGSIFYTLEMCFSPLRRDIEVKNMLGDFRFDKIILYDDVDVGFDGIYLPKREDTSSVDYYKFAIKFHTGMSTSLYISMLFNEGQVQACYQYDLSNFPDVPYIE